MLEKVTIALSMFLISGQAFALDCGEVSNPCKIDTGEYHIALPDEWRGGPVVMHLHGYGGSGAKVLKNKQFVEAFTARGYAFVAPTALPWLEGKPADWSVRDGWITYPRSDVRFLRDVLADLVTRANVNPDQVLLTGFSRGGSMVWEVACLAPDLVRGYAPASGGFWLPMTEECLGPVHMLHTHGFADKVVPLEGRSIHNEEFDITITQADVWEGLALWRRRNECQHNATENEVTANLWRKRWECEHGSLELFLHDGGHGYPKEWGTMALDWFESLEN
ncbi:alpha/beta hydrolase family esterase [Ruegeria atlantica]|uniref:alpha/beta hydrolase family esterase n=1 Tax=Ruegeria atlantica TaxID=81569 RepID=UPI0024946C1F|nr:polyhydroxybutyrate depolymerase [Ruegeria atlantica]